MITTPIIAIMVFTLVVPFCVCMVSNNGCIVPYEIAIIASTTHSHFMLIQAKTIKSLTDLIGGNFIPFLLLLLAAAMACLARLGTRLTVSDHDISP